MKNKESAIALTIKRFRGSFTFSSSARPVTGKVYFVSKNFNNVLHWDPVECASPEEKVLYSVQYKR